MVYKYTHEIIWIGTGRVHSRHTSLKFAMRALRCYGISLIDIEIREI